MRVGRRFSSDTSVATLVRSLAAPRDAGKLQQPTSEYCRALLARSLLHARAQPARTDEKKALTRLPAWRCERTSRITHRASPIVHRGLDASLDRFLEAQRRRAPSKPDLTQALSFLNCRPSNAAAPGPLVNLLLLRCLSTVCWTPCDFRVERRRRRGVTALSARARRSRKTPR